MGQSSHQITYAAAVKYEFCRLRKSRNSVNSSLFFFSLKNNARVFNFKIFVPIKCVTYIKLLQ